MIELPTWLFVMTVGAIVLLARNLLRVGRVQGFRLAVQAIGVVSHRYAQSDPTVLEPFEAEVAQAIGAALPNLVEGYAREQAANVTPIGSKLK